MRKTGAFVVTNLLQFPFALSCNCLSMVIICHKYQIDGGEKMTAVRLSPKYQVVIPREVRDSLHLHPGEMLQMLVYDNRIELIPVKNIKDMRGFLKGIDTTVIRERDRL